MIAAALLAVHAALAGYGAVLHSPGWDEPDHLVAGISHWRLGRFDLYRVNPPLVRSVAALPVLVAGVTTPWQGYDDAPGQRSERVVRLAFLEANGPRIFALHTYARWICIAFSLIGGWVCFCWASQLFGPRSGLAALALWCFSPNILAHAQMITPDAAAAAMIVATGYQFWKWLQRPRLSRAVVAGLTLGLAQLTKSSLLVLYPCWTVLWMCWRWRWSVRSVGPHQQQAREQKQKPSGTGFALILVISWLVLNGGYGFEGTGTPLGKYRFCSQLLSGSTVEPGANSPRLGNRWADSVAARIPVPLPRNYLMGIDIQKWDFDRGKQSYLNGQWRFGGWWYYYLVALGVKVPLGTIVLFFMAIVLTVARRPHIVDSAELCLLLPAVALFVVVSAHTGFSHHPRYVLPVMPLIFIWISKCFSHRVVADRLLERGAALALAASIAASLLVYPHSLSFFNLMAGGPRGGHRYLGAVDVDSALDWGQNLLLLRRWLDRHPDVRLHGAAVNSVVDPKFAGIEAPVPPTSRRSGWYAVSIDQMMTPGSPYQYFQQYEPYAVVGYTIYLFRLE